MENGAGMGYGCDSKDTPPAPKAPPRASDYNSGESPRPVTNFPQGRLQTTGHSLKIALRKKSHKRITQHLAAFVNDLHTLALDVSNLPTRIAELFPKNPDHPMFQETMNQTKFGGSLSSQSSILFPFPPASSFSIRGY
jgi:hypothetical protein